MSTGEIFIPPDEADERAVAVLEGREQLIETVCEPFRAASEEVAAMLRQDQPDAGDSDLPEHATREIYKRLLSNCRPVLAMWFDATEWSDEIYADPLFQVFGYAANKQAGVWRGDNAYSVHSHGELPYLTGAHGPLPRLTIAIAAIHDVTEVGQKRSRDANGKVIDIPKVTPESFKDKFNGLGVPVAIGAPTLVEAELGELKEYYGGESLIEALRANSLVRELLDQEDLRGTSQERRYRLIIENPLVYGGLAVQVGIVVDSLMKGVTLPGFRLSRQEQEELARSIVAVELADRMSDMATLPKRLSEAGDDPIYMRHKAMFYLSRMMNMRDTLHQAMGPLPDFNPAFNGYDTILNIQLDSINTMMGDESRGVAPISRAELEACYERFKQLQAVLMQSVRSCIEARAYRTLAIGSTLSEVS